MNEEKEHEVMRVYEEVKEYLDKELEKSGDYFKDDLKAYHLICRMKQMYNELYQVKLSYEKVLEQDFKGRLLEKAFQARQGLYNTRCGHPRKQDLIDGINFAIEDLNEILNLETTTKDCDD